MEKIKIAFDLENHAGILHDVTNCLNIGDLTIVGPERTQTLEIKGRKVEGKEKLDRRGRKQKKKGEMVREFYDRGVSARWIAGYKSVRDVTAVREKFNWNEVSEVVEEAIEKGQMRDKSSTDPPFQASL